MIPQVDSINGNPPKNHPRSNKSPRSHLAHTTAPSLEAQTDLPSLRFLHLHFLALRSPQAGLPGSAMLEEGREPSSYEIRSRALDQCFEHMSRENRVGTAGSLGLRFVYTPESHQSQLCGPRPALLTAVLLYSITYSVWVIPVKNAELKKSHESWANLLGIAGWCFSSIREDFDYERCGVWTYTYTPVNLL